MKNILSVIFSLILGGVMFAASPYAEWDGYTAPQQQGFVNDYADLLSDAEEAELTSLCERISIENECQIYIISVDKLNGNSIEYYSIVIGQSWGLRYSENIRSVLLIVAKQDKSIFIEANYNLQTIITTAICDSILLNYLQPAFNKNQYYNGFNNAVLLISEILKNETLPGDFVSLTNKVAIRNKIANKNNAKNFFLFLFPLISLIILLILRYFAYEYTYKNSLTLISDKENFPSGFNGKIVNGFFTGNGNSFIGGGGGFGGGGASGSW